MCRLVRNVTATWRESGDQTADPAFAGRLGNYVRELKVRTDDKQRLIGFSAEGECRLVRGFRYKVIDLKPGKFDGFEDR